VEWKAAMLKSMEDLFVVLLQDIYFSERKMHKTLTELAAASGDAALREAFAARRLGTAQVSRLLRSWKKRKAPLP
jgi:ferritin-like metal-binding protein YciE